ncbi:MAG TPA: serine/threonine-protein kinase, partial [Pyrinomonadaceae bacterium]|nr:serine/threonine-protein kinase [Pyrinomonadaceae bacterium]
MTNNGWEKTETIFHFALKLKAEEREAYLKTECADDLKLREDVESLLDSFENKADFLDKPVFELGLGAIGEAGQKNLAGQEIGVYRIEEKIGAGGMGEVYRAIDTRLNRQVALKFLPQSMENDRTARRRLVKEAQAAAALSHQNICAVHSVEESDEQIFIVMQYIEGETLDKSLNGSEISAEEFKFLARQIVTAVAFAHSHGVIHRDLKPGNIMLTEDGEIKILDFGLAKVNRETAFLGGEVDQQSNLSSSGLIIGTVAYMSPEQLRGKKADYRSDIFSLGIIFYELLAKNNPFNQKSQAETISAILAEEPAPLHEFAPKFPASLINLVEKCLEKDTAKRFQSAAEILVELDNAESYVETKSKRQKSFLLKAALATAVLLAIFAGVFLYNNFYSRRTFAVLPISIEQGLSEKEYLADGLTQNIIEKLSNLADLNVK